jgi:glutamate dehydrogenase (NAD(P)+)
VICGAVEYAGGTKADAMRAIDERIRSNTRAMLERAEADDSSPRSAAMTITRRRIVEAMSLRRHH